MGIMDRIGGGWPHTDHAAPAGRLRAKRERKPWSPAHKATLSKMWLEGAPAEVIADELERDVSAIYTKAHGMGLPRRKQRGVRKKRKWATDPSGQRRHVGVNPETKKKPLVLESHDPRFVAGITVFPKTVVPARLEPRMLKSGDNSRKIGERFDRGHWRGMPIFTLTLQERATCPRSCLAWAFCYGNNMPFAHRIVDDGTLTKRLWGELAALAAEHPAGYALRLHVLGDFFDVDYVEFWRDRLAEFPQLHIFGFTARRPPDPIGSALVMLVRDQPERFRMRFSGAGYETDSAEVVERKEDAKGIVCPAELDAKRSCATCGICPSSEKTIFFLRH